MFDLVHNKTHNDVQPRGYGTGCAQWTLGESVELLTPQGSLKVAGSVSIYFFGSERERERERSGGKTIKLCLGNSLDLIFITQFSVDLISITQFL